MVQLPEALATLRSATEVSAFLAVLFTPKEIAMIDNRWRACQLTIIGTPQRNICAELNVSNSTAARCARVVREASPEFRRIAARLGLPGPVHQLTRRSGVAP